MNETNSPAALAAQQIAAQGGIQLSGAEIGMIATLGGAFIHFLHQCASAWSNVGGLNGFKLWIKTGSSTPKV